MTHPVLIIGLGAEGPDGLATQEHIAQADQLWGSRQLLDNWRDQDVEQVIVQTDISEHIERLRQRGKDHVVILASNVPEFYGIAEMLLRYFPADELELVPHPSALQLAFARAGITWTDAILTNAHARPLSEVVGWSRRASKLGILTDKKHTPGLIARTLLKAGLDNCRAIVVENLGLPAERLIDTRLSALPGQTFAPLNVLLLIQNVGWRPQPCFAPHPDQAYAHRQGLVTQADIRALNLSRLALSETDTVWDIGAGSGAMSIEMSELAWRGQIFSVEYDPEHLGYIRENIASFGALNVQVIEGHAPAVLEGLPQPAAVFIGGSGGALEAILRHIHRVAPNGCRIVMNLVALEDLHAATAVMQALDWLPQVTQVNLAHGSTLPQSTSLARHGQHSPTRTRLVSPTLAFILTGTVK